MWHLSDAIKALENDAQYLRDNLPNLDDPPTGQQLQLVEAFIDVIRFSKSSAANHLSRYP